MVQNSEKAGKLKNLPRSFFGQAPSPLLVLSLFAVILPEMQCLNRKVNSHTPVHTHTHTLSPHPHGRVA